jgi:hypothetical protein
MVPMLRALGHGMCSRWRQLMQLRGPPNTLLFFQELSRRQKQPTDSLEEQIHAFSGMLDVSIRLIIHTMCHLLLIKALPLGRGYHKKS